MRVSQKDLEEEYAAALFERDDGQAPKIPTVLSKQLATSSHGRFRPEAAVTRLASGKCVLSLLTVRGVVNLRPQSDSPLATWTWLS